MCTRIIDSLDQFDEECQDGFSRLLTDRARLLESIYTSANIPIALAILSQAAANDSKTAAEVIPFILFGGISNLGDPDACTHVPEMQYCTLSPRTHGPAIPIISQIMLGVCLPAQCFKEETVFHLGGNQSFLPLQNSIDLTLNCGTHKQYVSDRAGSIVMVCICAVLLALAVAATLYDHFQQFQEKQKQNEKLLEGYTALQDNGSAQLQFLDTLGENLNGEGLMTYFADKQPTAPPALENDVTKRKINTLEKFLLCFSLDRNLTSLLSTKRPGDFHCLDGLRLFSMLWVIFGHVVVFQLTGAGFSNITDILPFNNRGFFSRFTAQVLPSAEFSVDTFFFISGFLVAFLTLKRMKEQNSYQKSLCMVPLMFLHRYLRLAPPVLFVVYFNIYLAVLVGSGPYWDQMSSDRLACTRYWWRSAFFLNNFSSINERDQTCYAVTWYLSVDFQLFLVTPFLLLLYRRNAKLGKTLICALMLASIVYSWVLAHVYELSFNTFSPSMPDYFNLFYAKPWTRCPPYFIGVLFAIFWYEKQFVPSKVVGSEIQGPLSWQKIVTLAALSGALLGVTVYGCWTNYRDIVPQWTPLEDHAYLALSKPAWTIGVAIMCYLCFTNQGGVVQSILEAPFLVPFARLSFAAYLVHPIVLNTVYCNRITKLHFSSIEYAFTFLGAVTGAMAGASGLYLFVEKPCQNLEKLLFKN